MSTIQDFCQEDAPGWDKITVFPETMSFIRRDGVHIQASIKEEGPMTDCRVLHISIGPLRACQREMTDEEHAAYLLKVTPSVLNEFFPDRQFRRMPDHHLKPDLNHYFSEIE